MIYHQARLGDTWHDIVELTLEEMPPIDRIVANWYTSTHPQSHFKNRLLVARATQDGRLGLLNRDLSVRGADGVADKHAIESAEQLHQILDGRFGIRLAMADASRVWQLLETWPT